MTITPERVALNPLKLLKASPEELKRLEDEGRIRIHWISDAGGGMDYIEIVKPS